MPLETIIKTITEAGPEGISADLHRGLASLHRGLADIHEVLGRSLAERPENRITKEVYWSCNGKVIADPSESPEAAGRPSFPGCDPSFDAPAPMPAPAAAPVGPDVNSQIPEPQAATAGRAAELPEPKFDHR